MSQAAPNAGGAKRAVTSRSEPAPDFPSVPAELLEALERAFPDRCPDSELSDAEIRERIGECRVVRFLKRHHQRQERLKQGRIL